MYLDNYLKPKTYNLNTPYEQTSLSEQAHN